MDALIARGPLVPMGTLVNNAGSNFARRIVYNRINPATRDVAAPLTEGRNRVDRIGRFAYNADNKTVEISGTGVFTADNNKQGRQMAAHLNRSLSTYMREWKAGNRAGGPSLVKGRKITGRTGTRRTTGRTGSKRSAA